VSTFDVVALGEPLIEVSTRGKITHGVDCGFAVSGDVVNTATAAVAAGARVAVVFDEGEPVDGWTLCSPDVDEIVEALKMNGVV